MKWSGGSVAASPPRMTKARGNGRVFLCCYVFVSLSGAGAYISSPLPAVSSVFDTVYAWQLVE